MGQAKRKKDLFKEYSRLLSVVGNMSSEPEAFGAASDELFRFSERFMLVDTQRDANERLHQMTLNSTDPLVQNGLPYFMDSFLSESMPCARFNSEEPATTFLVAFRMTKPAAHLVEILDDVSAAHLAICKLMDLPGEKVHVWNFVLRPETYTRSITAITLETYVARNGGHEWMAAQNLPSDVEDDFIDTVLLAVTIDAPALDVVQHCGIDCSHVAPLSLPYSLGDDAYVADLVMLEVGAAYSMRQQFAFVKEREIVARALKSVPGADRLRKDTGVQFSIAYIGSEKGVDSVEAKNLAFVMEFFDVHDGSVFHRKPVANAQDAMFVIPQIIPLLRGSGFAEVLILSEPLDLLSD
jgi:hypothetical protein